MAKVSTKNDTFTRMHEDPFIMIKQEEKKVSPLSPPPCPSDLT